jgi:hypothetical protein
MAAVAARPASVPNWTTIEQRVDARSASVRRDRFPRGASVSADVRAPAQDEEEAPGGARFEPVRLLHL